MTSHFLTNVAMVSTAVFMTSLPTKLHAQLPDIGEVPWLGYFSGYEQRNFEFGVDRAGQCTMYLVNPKTKSRGSHKSFYVSAQVVALDPSGKEVVLPFKKEEGFATELEPGLEHDEVEFTAETKHDAKVAVTIEYERDKVILDGRVIDPGKLQGDEIYFEFKISVPDLYGRQFRNADEDDVEKACKKDKVKFYRAGDRKRITLKSYKDVDLAAEENAKDGVTGIQVEMASQEGHDLIFTTDSGRGVLQFENQKPGQAQPLYKGYVVKWRRPYVKEEETENTKKTTLSRSSSSGSKASPLVIQVK